MRRKRTGIPHTSVRHEGAVDHVCCQLLYRSSPAGVEQGRWKGKVSLRASLTKMLSCVSRGPWAWCALLLAGWTICVASYDISGFSIVIPSHWIRFVSVVVLVVGAKCMWPDPAFFTSIHRRNTSKISFAALVLLIVSMCAYGDRVARMGRLVVLESEYSRRAAIAASLRDNGVAPGCITDSDFPRCAAFPCGAGVLDNWCGVVFDPDGGIVTSQVGLGCAKRLLDPQAVIITPSAFGGSIFRAEHLWKSWYFCWFT